MSPNTYRRRRRIDQVAGQAVLLTVCGTIIVLCVLVVLAAIRVLV